MPRVLQASVTPEQKDVGLSSWHDNERAVTEKSNDTETEACTILDSVSIAKWENGLQTSLTSAQGAKPRDRTIHPDFSRLVATQAAH